nr:hypothetical protein [Tanacetum cinerariifolium]
RAIIELVYLVEAHHHLNPIFMLKYDSPRRIDDSIVMLVLEAPGIPLRFGEIQLSLVALNPKLEVFYALSDNQLSGPLVDGRSKNLLIFRWEVVQVTLKPSIKIVCRLHLRDGQCRSATLAIVSQIFQIFVEEEVGLDCDLTRSFQVLRFKLSNSSSLAEPVHKCGNITGLRE